jgi:hypothetical protein
MAIDNIYEGDDDSGAKGTNNPNQSWLKPLKN